MLYIACLFLIRFAPHPSTAASTNQAYVEGLIRQLRDVRRPGAGYGTEFPSGETGGQFLPDPDIERFHGRVWKAWRPEVAPSLLKLIKIGLPALPALLCHLTDSTPTKVLAQLKPPTWIGEERDPRNRSPLARRIVYAMPNDWSLFDHYGDRRAEAKTYNVRVGDLCYIAVGQIVGRDLEVISFNPWEVRLTSPVLSPELATDVAKEWGNLSESEHIRSLEFDVLNNRMPYLAIQPFKRLRCFYPQEAARFAQILVLRPIANLVGSRGIGPYLSTTYNPDPFDFIVNTPHDELWMKVAAVDLSGWLMWSPNPEARKRAIRVKNKLFPNLDEFHSSPVDVTDVKDVLALVENTTDLPSKPLDHAIDSAFRKALAVPFFGYTDNDVLDDLAIACTERLATKGYFEPYRKYLRKRANQMIPEPRYSTVPNRRNDIRHWVKMLDYYSDSDESQHH